MSENVPIRKQRFLRNFGLHLRRADNPGCADCCYCGKTDAATHWATLSFYDLTAPREGVGKYKWQSVVCAACAALVVLDTEHEVRLKASLLDESEAVYRRVKENG